MILYDVESSVHMISVPLMTSVTCVMIVTTNTSSSSRTSSYIPSSPRLWVKLLTTPRYVPLIDALGATLVSERVQFIFNIELTPMSKSWRTLLERTCGLNTLHQRLGVQCLSSSIWMHYTVQNAPQCCTNQYVPLTPMETQIKVFAI